MGGSVKVVIREKNGKVTKMDRWTNNITWWIHRPEFIQDPHKILKEYIKKKDESGYYSPNATLAPDGYGLIVIDAINKVILTHQDYL